MKRVSDTVEGGNGNLGLKKSRFSDGIGESSQALQTIEGVEGTTLSQNRVTDSAPVDKDEDFFTVPCDFGGSGFNDLEEANKWDFDINFDSIFRHKEDQQGLGFDLNISVFGNEDVVGEKGSQGFSQGALVNNQKRVEVIDVFSDDGNSDVEIIGYGIGDRAKGKEIDENEVEFIGYGRGYGGKGTGIEVEMPYYRMEDLNRGLGIFDGDNVGFENNFVAGYERRYTREEKVKANISSEPWLSRKPDAFIDWMRVSESYGPNQVDEPLEEDEVLAWRPAALSSSSDSEQSEQVLRQAPPFVRRREPMNRESLRRAAREFARAEDPVENIGNRSSNQKEKSPTSRTADQLGNCPGPFSEALKMVLARGSKRPTKPLIEWKPSERNQDHSPTAPIVPSLLDLSLKALARNAEGIVSLEAVPDILRRKLTDMLCDMNEMNVHILNLLLEGCPTEIRVKNSSWLTEKQFQQTFENCRTSNLTVLQLDLCGQCMLDIALRDILAQSSNSFSSLVIVSLRGSCRITDSGVRQLVASAPALRSINLGHCNLLTCDAIDFIADTLGSNLRELYVDECQKINAMLTLPAFQKFKYLEVLSVSGLLTVTDQFICEMITFCSSSIMELDLSDCQELTDWSLKTIGSSCANLCTLDISNLPNLTDLALEYLANGCRSIQKLKISRNRFSDEAVAAFLETSGEALTELILNSVTKIGQDTAFSLARCSKKLLYLDISWCRRISNEALGLIVDSCSSLKLLKVFGCKQITSVFLNGHSNPIVRIIGLPSTPLLDHLNLLEQEEVLLRYSALPVSVESLD